MRRRPPSASSHHATSPSATRTPSQRPLLSHGITLGYQVREQAPSALVLGNIGIVQARQSSSAQLSEMMMYSQVDALCIHLNPAMELVQPEGDTDFQGGMETIARLLKELSVPIIVKETDLCELEARFQLGCG